MRKHKMPEMKEGGVNVTPLIDIVMCLIIFFMLVAKIGVSRGDEKSIIPPATLLGKPIDDIGNTLTLNVRDPRPVRTGADGEPTGERIGAPPEQPTVTAMVEGATSPQPIPIRTQFAGGSTDRPLLRVLKAAISGDPKSGAKGNPNLKLIILAERDLEYRLLQQVLITAAEAKVSSINFEMQKASIQESGQDAAPA